jgi:hypothetical protein
MKLEMVEGLTHILDGGTKSPIVTSEETLALSEPT